MLFENGNIVEDVNNNIKIAFNGNSSIYKSMKKDGILEDMKSKGIKWTFICSVDSR